MRCSTPGIRTAAQSKCGTRLSAKPIRKISTARLASLRNSAAWSAPASARRPSDSAIDTPPMNRKQGKIESVKVQPFQCACASCE
jgi:hypothetical protein